VECHNNVRELKRLLKDYNMKDKIAITPVAKHSTQVGVNEKVMEECKFDEDDNFGIPPDIMGIERTRDDYKDLIDEQGRLKDGLASVKFADQIKIDFIRTIDYRILCRFLGVTSVNDIKNHPYQSHPLITLILMESINNFMKSEGFEFAGELNFDTNGNSIPPEKNPWIVKGKETTFTITGFLFFEKTNENKKDNVAFYLFSDLERGGSSITCFSTDTNKSKNIIHNLQIFAKKNNCLRGAKLKDVNMISASFSEVEIDKKYSWDNFYFTDEIKDLFQLEVFDFVENVKKYNEEGIDKRGIMIFGKPGCVLADMKIKIRKKKKEEKHNIIEE